MVSVWTVIITVPPVVAGLVACYRVIKVCAKAIAWMDSHGPTIVQIAEQFHPNGGGSLHDKMVRIEKRLEDGGNRMDKIEGSISTIASHCQKCDKMILTFEGKP